MHIVDLQILYTYILYNILVMCFVLKMSKPTVFCSCYKCVHYDEHSLGRYVSESTKRRHQKIEKDYLADENSSDIEEIQQQLSDI